MIATYADGISTSIGVYLTCCDMNFPITISAAGKPDPNIPTLSQWGLIILGVCMVILGVVGIRARLRA